ncbi:MAG: helix-turn-helix domain-containing protein [Dehalococcoidia bacterium]
MKIPVEMILPDPDLASATTSHRKANGLSRRRESARGGRSTRAPIVRPGRNGKYTLVAGGRSLEAAIEAGEEALECTIREDLSEQEKWELKLAEQYHSSQLPPMQMGRAFMQYRDTHGVTQQELARRTGITPGTIHHYESLIRTLDPGLGDRVDSGDLTFKEARSIADIDDHERQREIARPFIDGKLSSVHVERIVGRAKSAPEMAIDKIIEEVINGNRQPATEAAAAQAMPAPASLPGPVAESIENRLLMIAGELDAMQLETIPEYRRLKLISSLRILDSRLKSSLAHLNAGMARESTVPRPLARQGAGAR